MFAILREKVFLWFVAKVWIVFVLTISHEMKQYLVLVGTKIRMIKDQKEGKRQEPGRMGAIKRSSAHRVDVGAHPNT